MSYIASMELPMLHWEGEMEMPLSFIDELSRASWDCAGAGGSRALDGLQSEAQNQPLPRLFFNQCDFSAVRL